MLTVTELKQKCTEVFKIVNLDFSLPIIINGRLTKTLGRCVYQRICGKVTPIRLEFSRQFLETATPHSIEEVIKHECAHAIACIEKGENQGHNSYFKSVCQRIGTNNDGIFTTVERTVLNDKLYKYTIICKDCCNICGYYHRAGNVVKYPSRYTCKCGGELSVIQNF